MTDPTSPTPNDDRDARMAWWHEAKLGMFVHWGCYSVLGRGEQIVVRDFMPLDEYAHVAQEFHPADDWADQIADQAERMGARYVVLTTRHHDGYCLFNTTTTDFNAVKTGPGRDLIQEYVQALRTRGLRVGFYFSVVNWHWRCQWDPETYAEDLPRMVQQLHDQVDELMTNYGKIDILWYDVPAVAGQRSPGAFGFNAIDIGKTPAEFYRSVALNARVKELQPEILINNRSGIPQDFGTPEQKIVADSEGRAWEACMTRNFAPNWACVNHSVADKTAGQILYHMIDAVRQGGNFLFNIGPDARGYVCDRDRHVMDQIGAWLQRNGEAVYGTSKDSIAGGPGQGPCAHYGRFTSRGRVAYLTLFFHPRDYLVVSRVGGGLKHASVLADGKVLQIEPMSNERYRISGLPPAAPEELATVIKLEFEQEPYGLSYAGAEWMDGRYRETTD